MNERVDPPIPSQAEFGAVVALVNQRRFAEAEERARALTKRFPSHPFGWKVLGAILADRGEVEQAVTAFGEAVRSSPNDSEAHNKLAVALRLAGRSAEAERSYRRALALKPDYAQAEYNFANLLATLGRPAEAEASYRRALELEPDYAQAHANLANLLASLGRLEEAEPSFRRALALKPDFPDVHNNLGNLLKRLGRRAETEASYRRALALNPDYPESHYNLANVLSELGRFEEAELGYRRAVELRPAFADAYNNLATTLRHLGRLDEADASCRRALQLKPDDPEVHNNLGNILKELGRPGDAEASYRRALALDPDFVQPRFGLGLAAFLKGDWINGWAGYEYRWAGGTKRDKRRFQGLADVPVWKGEPLDGKTILVFAEQGLGDQIQFIRVIGRLTSAAHVVALVPGPLIRLFQQSFKQFVQRVTFVSEIGKIGMTCDCQIALGSLPHRLAITRDDVLKGAAYLLADPAEIRRWGERIARDRRPHIGIVWRGGPDPDVERWRSVPLEVWRPLVEREDVRYVSLQKVQGGLSHDEREFLSRYDVIDRSDELVDFAETAALIACLDLVVSVDTAVAHLAGALGKPVWLLNRATSEWRWGWKETNSVWYQSLRIFNQERLGEWGPTFHEVMTALDEWRKRA
jgi:tetratricopeptide (TPR) repeat protein